MPTRFEGVLLVLPLLIASAPAPAAADKGSSRPNIVLILADDFGYQCVTANGGQSYQTPNLDRLAASGVRFEHCHVQPLCTPTRVQLMTGKYNIRNYVQFGMMLRTETTFAHCLKRAGYVTGICGKWQLGREVDSPRHFGFDESCLWQQTRRPSRYGNPGLEYNGVERDFNNGEYGPTLVNDFALDFIERHKKVPFFLYYPMMLTHDPFVPTPDSKEWDPKANETSAQKGEKFYADMTAYMDKMVGRVDAKLAEAGIRDNTLLLFVGDNGTVARVVSRFKNTDYPGGKGTTTERGTRVPLIASWPAVAKRGTVNTDLISSVDFLATLCEAAGATLPDKTDSVSFLPQIKGGKGTPRPWLYFWYSPRLNADPAAREWVFDHHYKLYQNGRFFDLSKDPFEAKPLDTASLDAAASAGLSKLRGALAQFRDVRPAELDRMFEQGRAQKAAAPQNGRADQRRGRRANRQARQNRPVASAPAAAAGE